MFNGHGSTSAGSVNLALSSNLILRHTVWSSAEWTSSNRAKTLAGLGQMLWPLCREGLARLICRLSSDRSRCMSIAKVSGEVAASKASGSVLFAVGLAADAWRMKKAIDRSLEAKTVRPAAAQATRSLTTWGATWAGAELLGIGGALAGLETGPGALVTGGVGAVVGGCLGMFASDWLAKKIEPSRKATSEDDDATDHCAC